MSLVSVFLGLVWFDCFWNALVAFSLVWLFKFALIGFVEYYLIEFD